MIEPKRHLKNVNRTMPFDEPTRLFKQRLDRNERNQPFSEGFIGRIKEKLTGELLMTYPETGPLYENIAAHLGVGRDRIILSNGSEQTIKLVFETYIDPGDVVILHSPGYAMYPVYAQLFQAKVVSQGHDAALRFDWDEYIKKISTETRMVVVENPNGFLGIATPLDVQHRLIQKAWDNKVLVLVDEAYFLFNDESVLDWIDQYDNLIVTRTFSKAFGLAGLRVGYLVSAHENIKNLTAMKPAYEATSLSAMIVEDLLNNHQEVAQYVEETKVNLAELKKGLSYLGFETSDSRANFIAVRLGDPDVSERLRKKLADMDILIRRPFREPELREWVRISAAPPEVQRALLTNLSKIAGKMERS